MKEYNKELDKAFIDQFMIGESIVYVDNDLNIERLIPFTERYEEIRNKFKEAKSKTIEFNSLYGNKDRK